MEVLDIVFGITVIVFWGGLFWMIVSTISRLFDKWLGRERLKRRIAELEQDFSKESQALQKQTQEQTCRMELLNSNFHEMLADTERYVTACQDSLKQMQESTDYIVGLSETLFSRLELVERWVSQKPPLPELDAELTAVLRQDIDFKLRYEKTVDQYRQELNERVHQNIISKLERQKNRDMGIEL